ncbi:MAG: helix-turn-helix transcriptional regulator [Clostridia bacterium]|nr:helix-turn-helix transcriptional regulator [Clostridia bacterium]
MNYITLKESMHEAQIYGEKSLVVLPFVCTPHFLACPPHWHTVMEFSRVTKGSMIFKRGDDNIILNEGDVVICCPEQLHVGSAGDEGVSYYTVKFDLNQLLNSSSSSPKYIEALLNFTAIFEPKTNDKEIVELLDKIYELYKSDCNPLSIVGRLYTLLGLLYEKCLLSYKTPSQSDIKFAGVIKYIHGHFLEKITAKNISVMFNYNESYFCRKFKNVTGTTIMNYILISRLDFAQKLLIDTKDEVSVVAEKSGFSDVAYFYRCFKKQYGCTPLDYRKQFKARQNNQK